MVAALMAVGLPMAWFLPPPEYRWVAMWLVIGMAPRMLGFLVGQINAVAGDLSRNVPAAIGGSLVSVAINLGAVWYDWGPLGLAVAHPAGNAVDLGLKFLFTHSTRRAWKREGPVPIEPVLRQRMRTFAFQGVGMVVLNILVWDRSDVFLLRHLNPDLSQVTFFSYAYSLIDRLLTLPQVLGGAMGLSLMNEFSKDRRRVVNLAVSSGTYLLLVGLPIMLGAVAISRPLWMVYGPKFAPAAPVFVTMALLAALRTALPPANTLLLASERQGFILIWTFVCGLAHLGLDIVLIPSQGALGAAIGNGVGQAAAVAGVWVYIVREFKPDVNWAVVGRILLSAVTMAATVTPIAWWLPPVSGAATAAGAGVLAYLGMLRLTRALRAEDRDRFMTLARVFPPVLRYPIDRILWSVIPQAR